MDGRRQQELTGEGIKGERAPRPVTIHRFDVAEGTAHEVLEVDIECSAGTYVRTLAADLGELLGGGAHLRNLRRTSVGAFGISEAARPDECELQPVATAVRSLYRVAVEEATAGLIGNGRVLDRWPGAGPWAVFSEDGSLLAVYEAFRTDEAKPAVVLPV